MENQELIKQVTEKAEKWLTPAYDAETQAEVKRMLENPDKTELIDSFYKDLEFGTGGLRGIMGAGTNRMNIYTVGAATQGLSNYLNKCFAGKKDISVVVGYDCRNNSDKFAKISADIFSANGIKVYLFEDLRPTPEMSYTIRKLGCQSGIILTASHNPKEYNGYKAYWDDGAQMIAPHDKNTIAEVNKIRNASEIKFKGNKELIEIIGKEIDDAYMAELKKLVLHQECIDKYGKELKIVYTPLHGTGNIPARRILRELGFENVYVVPEQELPDGDFPTVSYPNPEAAEAFELALALAKQHDADLVLATDPDADRLGVYVKDKDGEYHCLTGNMSGSLLAEYELSQIKATKGLPKDGALIKSIVTTNLVNEMAKSYGVKLVEVLTGFKFIGQKMLEFETKHNGTYLFGFEESYGCLIGTHARDKDAIVATMALCEAAAYYRSQGKTLWDAMIDIYEKYGYHVDAIHTLTLKGIEGLEKIKSIMDQLKSHTPKEIAGLEVLWARNYDNDTATNMKNKAVVPTGLPKSNVVYYELEGGAWLCVRPSGTEPKIKFYYGVIGKDFDDAQKKSEEFGEAVNKMIEYMM